MRKLSSQGLWGELPLLLWPAWASIVSSGPTRVSVGTVPNATTCTMRIARDRLLRVPLPSLRLQAQLLLLLPVRRVRGRGKTKTVTPLPKALERERVHILRLPVSRPARDLALSSLRESVPSLIRKCPFIHRKLTSEEKVKRDEWARAKEAQAKGGGNNTNRAAVKNPNAACAAFYIRGNCKKGAKCNLHHVEAGDRQSMPSAPATPSNQTTSQAAVGPALAEAPGTGFVNSILRKAAPAFTPGERSDAMGSVSR